MLFVNKTGNRVKVRLGDFYKNPYWKTVKPNDQIDLPAHYGKALGFKVVGAKDEAEPDKEKDKTADEGTDDSQSENGEKEPEENAAKPGEPEEFRRNLLKIKGIGKKTVRDIMQVYPTENDLCKAVQDGGKLPIRDDVAKLLAEYFEA